MVIYIILEFDVYLKSKMAELHEVQLKNLETKLKNAEYYSTKSIDDSKASVYYTPTDGTFSPGALQISPIHINYINENLDSLFDLKLPATKKFEFDQYANRYHLRRNLPERLIGGGDDSMGAGAMMAIYDVPNDLDDEEDKKRSSNEDNCCPCIDADDEVSSNGGGGVIELNQLAGNGKKVKVKNKFSIMPHENDMLLVNEINVCDVNNKPYYKSNGSGSKKKKKRYNKEYYYSVENVFDAKALPSTSCKLHQHYPINQQFHHQYHNTDHQLYCPPSVEKLNIIMDETGKTMLFNQCDNLLQTSTSLPEMQMTTAEIHGKHVLLSVENNLPTTVNVQCNGNSNPIEHDDSNIISTDTKF